ncbi:uncharacterized protein [Linepithema humile]|uniref:uncharacterized protein n=1 Tax=Linepithema humile TaxID=83485 RepID=UPI00351F0120
MATKGTDRISRIGKLKNRNEAEEKQGKLELTGEINKNKNGEKKKVSFVEREKDMEVRYETDRLEEVKKELMDMISKEIEEYKKERKGVDFRKAITPDLADIQPKYLFYLVNNIPKWIFGANAFSAPLKGLCKTWVNENEWNNMKKRVPETPLVKNDIGEMIMKLTEEYGNEGIIMGRDFNIRIGELDGEEEEGIARRSKDKTIENGGKKLIEMMQERGFNVLNGKTRGDWKESTRNKLEFRIEERVNSDHLPISLELETIEERRGKGKTEEKEVICWDTETKKAYQDRTNEIGWAKGQEEEAVDKIWEKLKDLVSGSMIYKKKKISKKEIEYKDW